MNDETKSEWLTLDSDSLTYRVRAACIEGTGIERDEAGAVVAVTLYLHSASIRLTGAAPVCHLQS